MADKARRAVARARRIVPSGATHRSILLVCVTALVVSATTATAASLITGKDVKDKSLTGRDIKPGSVALNRLSKGTQRQIKAGLTSPLGGPNTPGNQGENGGQGPQGPPGANGANGANGADGAKGADGAPGTATVGPHWGPIARNTIGSPVEELRNGPFVPGANGTPPFGNGSLGLEVADDGTAAGEEKASFGNEVDFLDDLVDDLDQVGFRVYTTGENSGSGNNMPNIVFEIDKNGPPLAAGDYSSLVFVPAANSPSNQWSPYIDATSDTAGDWYLTGAVGTAVGCNQATPCDFDDLQADPDLSDDASILTAAVGKGRDKAWQGAIDGLRINNEVFDFELFGTVTRAP